MGLDFDAHESLKPARQVLVWVPRKVTVRRRYTLLGVKLWWYSKVITVHEERMVWVH